MVKIIQIIPISVPLWLTYDREQYKYGPTGRGETVHCKKRIYAFALYEDGLVTPMIIWNGLQSIRQIDYIGTNIKYEECNHS